MKSRLLRCAALLFLAAQMIFLSGCDIQIFERKKDPYEIILYKKDQLENEVFYIKDATNFRRLYMGNGTASGVTNEPSNDRLLWFMRNKVLLPTLYGNEIIAYPSAETSLTDIVVERYEDIGYSFGLHGARWDEDGITVDVKANCIEGTSMYSVMSRVGTNSVKIIKINGAPVTASMVNQSGVFTGLQQDGVYNVGFYAGSRYMEKDITADIWFLRSYEVFSIDRADSTANGYLSLEFPDDWKDGYYLVNGTGMCIYYQNAKADVTGEEDMNVPYYSSESEQMAVFSQQYVKELQYLSSDVTFTIEYSTKSLLDGQEAKAYLTSPQGDRLTFLKGAANKSAGTGTLTISLKEAGPGKWMINAYPKNIDILDVTMDSNESSNDNKQEIFRFHFDDPVENTIFYVSYVGAGNISAMLINAEGETYNFGMNNREGRLEYNVSWMPEGDYDIYVYHLTDTAIDKVDYEEDEEQYETEIIVVGE